MTLELLDEKGFVFLDEAGKPFRCCMRGDTPWLFYWHPDNQWVSLRKVNQTEIWSFPRNLTEEQQQYYNDKHQEQVDEFAPEGGWR